LPTPHAAQADELPAPTNAENVPATQEVQVSAACALIASEYVPASHAVHVVPLP
jgi:hypothetical protein